MRIALVTPATKESHMAEQPTLPKAVTFADFIRMLEHGELNQNLSIALTEIAAHLSNHAHEFGGGKAKGKLTVTIDFELKQGVYEIQADFKKKLPELKRPRTIAWGTPDNYFTPQDPRQLTMFGGPRQVRDAYGDEASRVMDA